jgi:hypothetical protein
MARMNARLRVYACILFLSLHTLRFLCLCRDKMRSNLLRDLQFMSMHSR